MLFDVSLEQGARRCCDLRVVVIRRIATRMLERGPSQPLAVFTVVERPLNRRAKGDRIAGSDRCCGDAGNTIAFQTLDHGCDDGRPGADRMHHADMAGAYTLLAEAQTVSRCRLDMFLVLFEGNVAQNASPARAIEPLNKLSILLSADDRQRPVSALGRRKERLPIARCSPRRHHAASLGR